MVERTLFFIKPEGFVRRLVGDVLGRFHSIDDIKIIAAKLVRVDEKLAKAHYDEHKDKPFFNRLVDHLTGKFHNENRVLAFVLEGPNVVKNIREVVGSTFPEDAAPRSIRGAYGRVRSDGLVENVVHASSSVEDAEREIALWFNEKEIQPSYNKGE